MSLFHAATPAQLLPPVGDEPGAEVLAVPEPVHALTARRRKIKTKKSQIIDNSRGRHEKKKIYSGSKSLQNQVRGCQMPTISPCRKKIGRLISTWIVN